MSRPRVRISVIFFSAFAVSGCFVFDESLYLHRDGGTGTTFEGGIQVLSLADTCEANVPMATFEGGATSWMRAFDTRTLRDDHTNVGCTGRSSPGPDGFFAVDMEAGERFHIHIRRRSAGADPVLYVLRQICDERNCDRPFGLDACRADSDEHLSILATSAGRYYVGIDSGNEEGFAGSVEVFRPTCGNGMQEHGESCEPGVDPTLTCTDQCRVVLSGAAQEHEVNDDSRMANELELGAASVAIGGRIGTLCELDVFAFDVPAGGGSIRASLRTAAGGACPSGTPTTALELLGADGIVVFGEGSLRSGSACPSIDETDAFATNLVEGRYHLRIHAVNTEIVRPFDYSLAAELVIP